MNLNDRGRLNPLLTWLWQLLSFYSTDEIKIPSDFREQVLEIKLLLQSDTSGIVNSILDFAINAALVDYTIETEKPDSTELLNNWLGDVNGAYRGKLPTGIDALAKEYFRERWKGSSLLLLRTLWEDVDGIELPTQMWFVDGENIKCVDRNDNRVIGTEVYKILVKNEDTKNYVPTLENTPNEKVLPVKSNELIFVQKPFAGWSDLYPTPFILQRGLYKNLKLLNLLNQKGEKIIGKALEYLLTIKKGTEQLALKGMPDFIYSEEDLKKVKADFKAFNANAKTETGTPTYVTNFDTDMEHFIPDYSKAMNEALYAPIERRLLAGLGLIDIVQGVASTRRESMLNPKPFIADVKQGVADFQTLLSDVVKTIVRKNQQSHPKLFGPQFQKDIRIHASTIDDFLDDSIRTHLRSMYDRGVISKQTFAEICGADYISFNIEKKRRKLEKSEGLNDLMYPPIIQNLENTPDDTMSSPAPKDKNKDKNTTEDKQGIEKKNYKASK